MLYVKTRYQLNLNSIMHILNNTSSNYLEYTIEQKECHLNKYGRTVESIKEDIKTIKLWLEKQPHIPKVCDDNYIEHCLFANKFIFNNAKKSLDWYYRMRNIYPDHWKAPDENSMLTVLNQFYFFPLPKMTSSNCRVTIMKMKNKALDVNFDACSFIAYAINIADFITNHDCISPKIVVIDCKDIKLDFCSRFSPVIMRTGITIFEKCYHNSVNGIHLINLPALLETFLNLTKSLLNPKMTSRIQVHSNVNSMFEVLDRKIFPKDFGGDEISFDELHELWKNELTKDLPWFKQRKVLVTDESLRVEEAPDCDFLGFKGNFRKLNLD